MKIGLKKNLKKSAQLQFGKRRVSQYFELANQANRTPERKNIQANCVFLTYGWTIPFKNAHYFPTHTLSIFRKSDVTSHHLNRHAWRIRFDANPLIDADILRHPTITPVQPVLKWHRPKRTLHIKYSVHRKPSVLESKSNQLILHMHYSCCPNPIDLLLSQNLISNPIPFVIQCPSLQHRASSFLFFFTCAAWLISAIWTILITSPLWSFFFLPSLPVNTCLLSRETFIWHHSSSRETHASSAAQLWQKMTTWAISCFIVHLGQLLIKT